MPYVLGAVVLVCLLLLAAFVLLKQKGFFPEPAGEEALPFRKKNYLLTKAELAFYRVLIPALDGRLMVFAKVRLLDLLWLPKGTQNAQGHRNRVQSKHVDFVLCDLKVLKPVLVIELDDASHARAKRQERDAFVDRVLASADLPIVRVPARRSYSPVDLKAQIDAAIGGTVKP